MRTGASDLLLAFLRRDAFFYASYRFGFALDLVSVLLSTATFFFVARLIGDRALPSLAAYGGDYFAFVLIGIAFSACQGVCLHSFSQSVRKEQLFGTLESVLTSRVSFPWLILASSQWDFLYAGLQVGLYLGAGTLFFGLALPAANLAAFSLVLAFTAAAFLSIGLASAAVILRFRRGDPAAWLIAAASDLLAGVYFPVSILPEPLRLLSKLVPMTHSLEGLRMTLLGSAGVADVLPQILALAAFSAVLGPLGVLSLRLALDEARKNGSLGHY
ncbi:MAG: ABC transporter permease [Elusimicrobia bacterium]|nr:ABC transporter permease [Elusimicrobiota bacterium]